VCSEWGASEIEKCSFKARNLSRKEEGGREGLAEEESPRFSIKLKSPPRKVGRRLGIEIIPSIREAWTENLSAPVKK
jgi:hypothetical protein